MTEKDYYYLPHELLTPEFSDFSPYSKMLFAITLTEAENAKAIVELSDLIHKVGYRRITAYMKELRESLKEMEG